MVEENLASQESAPRVYDNALKTFFAVEDHRYRPPSHVVTREQLINLLGARERLTEEKIGQMKIPRGRYDLDNDRIKTQWAIEQVSGRMKQTGSLVEIVGLMAKEGEKIAKEYNEARRLAKKCHQEDVDHIYEVVKWVAQNAEGWGKGDFKNEHAELYRPTMAYMRKAQAEPASS